MRNWICDQNCEQTLNVTFVTVFRSLSNQNKKLSAAFNYGNVQFVKQSVVYKVTLKNS